ncbi:laminin subunit alpha-2-like [Haliotis cracherodii]|uniref:laminin subunit alpha-2-like n=1 Tax=Haliotis cracherodii TaxID=6455 RepID=UPI0039ECA1FD
MGCGLFYGVFYLTCVCVALGQDEDLFPVVFNLASRAQITANATCGETSEVFCKLVEHVRIFPAENRHCDICDARSLNPAQRHSIRNAIDGSNQWWQSPTLTNGYKYNYVTITLDLGQVYQIAYVILKAANSPRPGNWILERSLDGTTYQPWQYFAMTGRECQEEYGLDPTYGIPTSLGDDEVICTTRYSHLIPLENGEIFISLVNGRPGINQPSKVLLDFTSARFLRMRFQKIRNLNADLMTFRNTNPQDADPSVTRRYYYSIKDISIGGHCICYGHAKLCGRYDSQPNRLKCQCEDNTCGDNCERCCPGYNQNGWNNGNGVKHICEPCNCHGKADDCVYNATVNDLGLSLNMEGKYQGGGVCLNCREFSTGINCEQCIEGYYRPSRLALTDSFPCRRCNCQETMTSSSTCITDDSRVSEGLNPGDCVCKPGFSGRGCNRCAYGYYGFPRCRICPCNPAGSVNPEECRRRCRCKVNVEGRHCDQCKPGYYNLDKDNAEGCTQCYCHGVSSVCKSAEWGLTQVNDMNGWVLSTREPGGLTLLPRMFGDWLEAKTYLLNGGSGSGGSGWPVQQADILYWVAPMMFLGNRLTSYGGKLAYTIKYTIDDNLDLRYHLSEPDVIIEGNGFTIINGKQFLREKEENSLMVRLHESYWKKLVLRGNSFQEEPVSKQEFMLILQGLTKIMIRASYHTAQDTIYLKDVTLDTVSPISQTNISLPSVEQCVCPMGYAGLSCESCAPGYRRLNNTLHRGMCLRCNCFNHAMQCDPVDGKCHECQHNTMGAQCDRCLPGYYGNPRRGSPDDCKPCACPHQRRDGRPDLCEFDPTPENREDYKCSSCPEGQAGKHCDRCAAGFYGNPGVEGGSCRRCYCSGNIDMGDPASCDPVTGQCRRCSNNTQGEYCQKCITGYYGSAVQGNCRACNCYENGSYSSECDERNGQCSCKPRYTGRQCNSCQSGYGDVTNGCPQCRCSRIGSTDLRCSSVTGQCPCRPGIGGLSCDRCKDGMYGFRGGRCSDCECFGPGTNGSIRCDQNSGQCECHPKVMGRKCEQCQDGFWGIQSGMGCLACDCDRIGASSHQCDTIDGQCPCRANVGGKFCDQCLPGYYGFNYDGCKRCERCDLPGHICDPRTGKCVCPPNTKGPRCEDCLDNCWGYNNETGCKKNVEGRKCSKCRRNTFSLDEDNPSGCTACYCFMKTRTCSQAPYVWLTISAPTMRRTISQLGPNVIQDMFGFHIIPSDVDEVAVPTTLTDKALYWSLPATMLGDRILSYNGRLDFVHYFESDKPVFGGGFGSQDDSKLSPLVVLIGNGFILTYNNTMTLEPRHPDTFTARLHENYWRIPGQKSPVSRRLLMVVLQHLEAIFVQATSDGYATYAELGPISLQVAEPATSISSGDIALGIELCDCPDKYSGTSCQNPGDGYFREKQNGTNDLSQPEITIGRIRRCRCHGHSDVCDPETGLCMECQHNTTGDRCDQCLPGYFGVATRGSPWDCSPCACPRIEPSNSFSSSCEDISGVLTCTNCSEGYTGTRCERCSPGYYGNPLKLGSECKPCNCNKEGSVTASCDVNTGRCDCLPGIEGLKCDECDVHGFAVQNGTCVSCYTGCPGVLLNDLQNMTLAVSLRNITVPLPWKELRRIQNETVELQALVNISKMASLANVFDYRNQTEFFKDVVERLMNRVSRTQRRINGLIDDASKMLNNATKIEDNISRLFDDIRGDINDLETLVERLFNTQSGVNITAAFAEAQRILNEILGRDFSRRDDDSYDERKLAEKLLRRVLRLKRKNFNATDTEKNLKVLTDALEDLKNQSQKASDVARRVLQEETLRLGAKLADILEKYDEIEDLGSDTSNLVADGNYYIDEARDLLDRLKENIWTLQNRHSTLDAVTDRLTEIVGNLKRTVPRVTRMVDQAWEHARRLARYAAELDRLFNKTRVSAEDALRAAKVYENIVKAIETAEEAARDALSKATDAVRLANVDRIRYDVEKSINRSRALKKQADEKKDGVDVLDADLIFLQKDVDGVQKVHEDTQRMLDMLKRDMARLPSGFRDQLGRLTQTVDDAKRKAGRTNRKVDKLLDKMRKLRPKMEDLQNQNTQFLIQQASNQLEKARENKNKILGIMGNVQQQAIQSQMLQNNVSRNILLLQERIRLARELANNMKLSMKGDGRCVRSYRSISQPGATNDISFGFKLNKTQDSMLLVLIQKSQQEFLALELINNRIRFTWDNGGGQGSVTHDVEVKLTPADTPEGDKWYRVIAQRIGRIGLLKVYHVKDSETTAKEASGTSPVGHSVLKLDLESDVFFGGVDAKFDTPPGISRRNMTGCIGDMKVDRKAVGMYNFKNTSASCRPCNEVPTRPISTNEYHFDGTGYVEKDRDSYRSDRINVAFSFKTYWENAMLHFSGNPDMGDFMSIELRDGKVMFQFYNGGMSLGKGVTKNKYNNNKWTKVGIERNKLQALLKVDDEQVFIEAKRGNNGLDLKGYPFYFGGIPASLDLSKYQKITTFETNNFFGCMRDVGLGGFSTTMQNLFTGNSVGMSAGCSSTGIRKSGFHGEDGFAMFKAESMPNEADVSVSFITKQRDAMLLLAMDHNDNFYSLSLYNGQIEGRFAAGGRPVVLQSADTYNDEKLHNIAVVKSGRTLTMIVDDKRVAEGSLPIGINTIPIDPDKGRMFLGGLPGGFDASNMVASRESLDGCISDIIVNGKLLNLNLPVEYKRADIGRCPYDLNNLFSFANNHNNNNNNSLNGLNVLNTPSFPETTASRVLGPPPPSPQSGSKTESTTTTTATTTTTSTTTTTTTPTTTTENSATASTAEPPESCGREAPQSFEEGAFVFGNSENSFAEIKFKRKEVVKTFNISFSFRSYYADGLLFLLTNQGNTDYLVVQLQNGEIVLSYRHKADQHSIRSGRRLGDGKWHSVVVHKGSRNIHLKVENENRIKESIARRLDIAAPMYVGGLPDTYPSSVENLVPHSLRGCLRKFTINGEVIDIADTKVISGVGPCNKNVEPGASFQGNSWGIYSQAFHIGEFLKISLEFRTNSGNGTLVTISSESGDLGMTLEVYKGMVQFTIKNNDDKFTAFSPNTKQYIPCDQKWHRVTAEVIRNVVSIEVDDWGKRFGPSLGSLRTTPTDSPMFIGGMPESFPQVAASTREGFSGCMRNVNIDGNVVDWYSLVDSRNIRRSACPAA